MSERVCEQCGEPIFLGLYRGNYLPVEVIPVGEMPPATSGKYRGQMRRGYFHVHHYSGRGFVALESIPVARQTPEIAPTLHAQHHCPNKTKGETWVDWTIGLPPDELVLAELRRAMRRYPRLVEAVRVELISIDARDAARDARRTGAP